MNPARLIARLVLALLFAAANAWASPEERAPDTEAALAAGHTGLERYSQGEWQEALERFREADRLAHSPVFVLYAARCEQKLGRLLEARRDLRRIVGEQLPEDAPDAWRVAVADAKRELGELHGRIPRLVVRVEGADLGRVRVSLGARTLRRSELGGPIEVNPGSYTVIARSQGGLARRDVRVSEGDPIADVVLRIAAPLPRAPVPPARSARSSDSARGESSGSQLAPAVAFGVGAAAIVTGVVLGVMAASRASGVKERCQGNSCLASDADEGAAATRLANASTVAFAIGGVGIGAGVVLLLVDGDDGREQRGAMARFGARF